MTADEYLRLPEATRSAVREMKGVRSAPRLISKPDPVTRQPVVEMATGKNARRNTGRAFGGAGRRKCFMVGGQKAASAFGKEVA